LPPTSPLRKIKDVELSIKKLIKYKFDAVWTISPTDSKFHPYKSLFIKKNKLNYFTKKGSKIKYRQQLSQTYYRNGACYTFTRKSILKKEILPKNSGYVISNSPQISIDTLKDLDLAKKFIYKW